MSWTQPVKWFSHTASSTRFLDRSPRCCHENKRSLHVEAPLVHPWVWTTHPAATHSGILPGGLSRCPTAARHNDEHRGRYPPRRAPLQTHGAAEATSLSVGGTTNLRDISRF